MLFGVNVSTSLCMHVSIYGLEKGSGQAGVCAGLEKCRGTEQGGRKLNLPHSGWAVLLFDAD